MGVDGSLNRANPLAPTAAQSYSGKQNDNRIHALHDIMIFLMARFGRDPMGSRIVTGRVDRLLIL